jgi:hypothetical protein
MIPTGGGDRSTYICRELTMLPSGIRTALDLATSPFAAGNYRFNGVAESVNSVVTGSEESRLALGIRENMDREFYARGVTAVRDKL